MTWTIQQWEQYAKQIRAMNETLLRQNAQLRKQLTEPATHPKEEYWNNKRPKTAQVYVRKEIDGDYQIDVRNYFQPYDSLIPTFSGKDNDEIALKSLCFVIDNIKYTGDKEDYGYPEYWAWAYQTLKRKKGDCEDGAILMANIMLKSGIPYWRIRLNAGSVNGGGHAYVTYCRESDDEFVVLDWCYWGNKKKMSDRPKHSEEQNYSNENKNYYIWFSWNLKYCFGEMNTMTGKPNHFKTKAKK